MGLPILGRLNEHPGLGAEIERAPSPQDRAPNGEPAPNQELVSLALRVALAEKLQMEPELLGEVDSEATAAALHHLSEADRRLGGLPAWGAGHEPFRDPHDPPRRDLLSRALRDELAAELGLAPTKLARLSGLGAAHTLSRLREIRRGQPAASRATDEFESAPLPDSREVVARVIRDGLAERLAVPPQQLEGMSPELAAVTLVQLIQMRHRVWQLSTQLDRGSAAPAEPFAERREVLARTLRDLIAEDLKLHPRLVGGISPVAGATLLARLTEARREVRSLKARLAVDELTGALRRRAGLAALEREIRRARRLGGGLLVVAFVDVDSLKAVNDSAGHAAGDRLLQALVKALRSRLRTYDVVIRWGGDEFVCILPQTDRADSAAVMGEVREQFATLADGHGFSIGLAILQEEDTAADLVARADQDLYAAKRSSRERRGEPAGREPGPEPPILSREARPEPPASGIGVAAGPAVAAAPPPRDEPAAEPGDDLWRRLRRLLGGEHPA